MDIQLAKQGNTFIYKHTGFAWDNIISWIDMSFSELQDRTCLLFERQIHQKLFLDATPFAVENSSYFSNTGSGGTVSSAQQSCQPIAQFVDAKHWCQLN